MESTVSQMKVSELRKLISEVVEEKLAEMIDPDRGLVMREELVARIRDQKDQVAAGQLGTPLDKVMADLGLD